MNWTGADTISFWILVSSLLISNGLWMVARAIRDSNKKELKEGKQ